MMVPFLQSPSSSRPPQGPSPCVFPITRGAVVIGTPCPHSTPDRLSMKLCSCGPVYLKEFHSQRRCPTLNMLWIPCCGAFILEIPSPPYLAIVCLCLLKSSFSVGNNLSNSELLSICFNDLLL